MIFPRIIELYPQTKLHVLNFILKVLRFIHSGDSVENIVLFLVAANQRRER